MQSENAEIKRELYAFLWKNGKVLFDHATPSYKGGLREVKVLIVGDSPYKKQMENALSWYVTITGWTLEILKCSLDDIAEDDKPTFIFVCYDDEDENRRISITLKAQYEDADVATVDHESLSSMLNEVYRIGSKGYDEARYEMEVKALEHHLLFGNEDTFFNNAYYFFFELSSAIHIKQRRDLEIPGYDKIPEQRTEEERENLRRIEHRRFCQFLKSEGWTWSGSLDPKSIDLENKKHNHLVPYEMLSEEARKLNDDV